MRFVVRERKGRGGIALQAMLEPQRRKGAKNVLPFGQWEERGAQSFVGGDVMVSGCGEVERMRFAELNAEGAKGLPCRQWLEPLRRDGAKSNNSSAIYGGEKEAFL